MVISEIGACGSTVRADVGMSQLKGVCRRHREPGGLPEISIAVELVHKSDGSFDRRRGGSLRSRR